jgi:D-alanyl-D-alanine carboxypeptidase
LGLATVVALLAVASDPADARSRRKRSRHAPVAEKSYSPPYAAIVVDAKNGSVLHQANPDSLRHPASLTKIMTLYLLFERMESGKIALDAPMPVSAEASSQAPTKLGLKPGDSLKVEDAIKGLVTKSANDAAVVIAEALGGGSEDEFARQMTRKARALGMRNTTYRNASGLPNDEQITTARDQALLGIAIQERFPRQYRYFSLANFVYRGHAMRNHNRLLGQVEGVDGIKTGYTRDSGFNLVTSVRRGPRHIVAVVLGGRSASSRDARMRALIEETIDDASTKAPVMQVAEAAKLEPKSEPKLEAKFESKPEPAPVAKPQIAAAGTATLPIVAAPRAAESTATVSPGSNAPITPVKVKTMIVKLVPPKSPTPDPASDALAAKLAAATPEEVPVEAAPPVSSPMVAFAPVEAPATTAAPKPGILGKLPVTIAAPKEAPAPAATPSPKAEEFPTRHTTRGGWAIQVGAYEDESEAKQHLSNAKSKVVNVSRKAEPYIERTVKGAKTYYRARFAGFDRDQAEAVCKRLKRDDITCMALKI